MKKLLTGILLIAVLFPATGQKSGESVYTFLNLTNSARASALGGANVSIKDDDLNLVFHNPALLSPGMDQNMNINYVNYFAGINYGYTSYAFKKDSIGMFAAGIHYVDYGTFDGYDQYGVEQGTFRASEYALNLVYSRELIDTVLSVGINVKPIFSLYEVYSSLGLTADLGLVYYNPKIHASAGLVLKNMGMQITSYSGTREKVPFEIQAGYTQGLAHAPFRFTVLLTHLERWDLTYPELEDDNYFFGGETDEPNKFDVFADRLMRHAIFGVELLLGENFHFDFGYNYKRRQEMKNDNLPGGVGLSWGFGFKINRFHVAYGRSTYHLAGGTNHFSLTTDLSTFYRNQ